MKLLEYEAKKILNTCNISVPKSYVVDSTPQFLPAVIKSQVPTGGRGKAGGVAVVKDELEYSTTIERIGKLDIKGFIPSMLLAEELIAIERELYLSLMIDLSSATIVLMAHTNGGIEIESNDVDEFLRIELTGANDEMAGEQLAEYYNLPGQTFALQDLIKNLYHCFVSQDATLLEINPLILTEDDTFIAGDCKLELDDAAYFRHPEWAFELSRTETNFVTLDYNGTVATIANGAGLAMATVDAVADAGMVPANFLDIGGGANEASVRAAFDRITNFPNVSVIIINIFAGITRCDEVARAIVAATTHVVNLPTLSIRLAGTNFEEAERILKEHNIPILKTLDECIENAKKVDV